jgi:2-dehydropantoate 2-reductase
VRLVIYGAGAIGGVLGARLMQGGSDVTFVARGENYDALAARGLRFQVGDEESTLAVTVVRDPSALDLSPEDIVILTVKSNDTRDVIDDLERVAPPDIAVVCAQNGVENERIALRKFPHVYGLCVMCPATHLEPGVVRAGSSPVTGLMDLGRWPAGVDERAGVLADILGASTFESVARDDIARWKWGKLLMNLGNAVQAVCGTDRPRRSSLDESARKGLRCCARRRSTTWIATKTPHGAGRCSALILRVAEGHPGKAW